MRRRSGSVGVTADPAGTGRSGRLRLVAIGLALVALHASVAVGWVVVPIGILIAGTLVALIANLRGSKNAIALCFFAVNLCVFGTALGLYLMGTKGVAHVLALPSFLILATVSVVFGRSLAKGAEPVVNRFMRLELGEVPVRAARYGRHLTVIWAIVLAAMSIEAVVLSFSVDLATWSWIVNVANPAILILFFFAQHAFGERYLPHRKRPSAFSTIRAMLRPATWLRG